MFRTHRPPRPRTPMIDAGTLVVIPLEVPLRRELRAVWAGPATPSGLSADLIAIAAGRARRPRY